MVFIPPPINYTETLYVHGPQATRRHQSTMNDFSFFLLSPRSVDALDSRCWFILLKGHKHHLNKPIRNVFLEYPLEQRNDPLPWRNHEKA